jgi:hypothetical protein
MCTSLCELSGSGTTSILSIRVDLVAVVRRVLKTLETLSLLFISRTDIRLLPTEVPNIGTRMNSLNAGFTRRPSDSTKPFRNFTQMAIC